MTTKLTLPVGDSDHVQGAADAAITLLEYGDYECPHCGHAYPIVKAVQQRLGRDLRFVFREFPLAESHPHAEAAAEAAEAAGAQGQYWTMHDTLFEHQSELRAADLLGYAEHMSLDVDRWVDAMNRHAYQQRVQDDFMGGVMSGVNGTPTFFINGRRHDAAPDERSLLLAIEAALERT